MKAIKQKPGPAKGTKYAKRGTGTKKQCPMCRGRMTGGKLCTYHRIKADVEKKGPRK